MKYSQLLFPVWLISLFHCFWQVVADAGHSANEPGIAAELVAANEKLKNLIKNGHWKRPDAACP